MSRLIDADILKADMAHGEILIDEEVLKCDTMHDMLLYLLKKVEDCMVKIIDNQPTAYDVEAVVKELEQEKYVAYMKGDIAAMEHNSALNKAIEIVRRGGRDD